MSGEKGMTCWVISTPQVLISRLSSTSRDTPLDCLATLQPQGWGSRGQEGLPALLVIQPGSKHTLLCPIPRCPACAPRSSILWGSQNGGGSGTSLPECWQLLGVTWSHIGGSVLIYGFIYLLWLRQVFTDVWAFFCLWRAGPALHCRAQVSQCTGFSCGM